MSGLTLPFNHVMTSQEGLREYLKNYAGVFSEVGYERLPPHLDFDCPVDLIPISHLPKGTIYNL